MSKFSKDFINFYHTDLYIMTETKMSSDEYRRVLAFLEETQEAWNIFTEESELYRYAQKQIEYENLSLHTQVLLSKADQFSKETDGIFDATKGVQYKYIKTHKKEKVEQPLYDVSSLAKGYALSIIGVLLHAHPSYLLNFGGQIYLRGKETIHLERPRSFGEAQIICSINLENESISTSSNFTKNYTYGHIHAPQNRLSLSIIGRDPLICDMLSTVCYMMEYSEILFYASAYNCDVLLFEETTIYCTPGLVPKIKSYHPQYTIRLLETDLKKES